MSILAEIWLSSSLSRTCAEVVECCQESRGEAGLCSSEIEFRTIADPERGRIGSGSPTMLDSIEVREKTAGVAACIFDAYVTTAQKGHELAAGYLLVSGAGGSVTDLGGRNIKNNAHDFDSTYGIFASGNAHLGSASSGFLSSPSS